MPDHDASKANFCATSEGIVVAATVMSPRRVASSVQTTRSPGCELDRGRIAAVVAGGGRQVPPLGLAGVDAVRAGDERLGRHRLAVTEPERLAPRRGEGERTRRLRSRAVAHDNLAALLGRHRAGDVVGLADVEQHRAGGQVDGLDHGGRLAREAAEVDVRRAHRRRQHVGPRSDVLMLDGPVTGSQQRRARLPLGHRSEDDGDGGGPTSRLRPAGHRHRRCLRRASLCRADVRVDPRYRDTPGEQAEARDHDRQSSHCGLPDSRAASARPGSRGRHEGPSDVTS